MRGLVLGLALVVAVSARAAGQERLLDRGRTIVAPTVQLWTFGSALPQESLSVKKVSQFSLPIAAVVDQGRLTIDVAAALAAGRLTLADGRTVSLSGLTDVRVRAVGRLWGDRLLVTAGATLPSGKTKLAGREIDAIRILAAPGLRMPTPALGLGVGATAGLVFASTAGAWNVAVGTSVEARGSYQPVESQLAGVPVPTDLNPGNTVRVSLGADRLVGSGRLALMVAADLYGTDLITLRPPSGGSTSSTYQLGPQFSAHGFWDLGVAGFDRFTIAASERYRSRFKGLQGDKVVGSDGNQFEASIDGLRRLNERLSLYLRLEGRIDSGLEVDNSITTAAMSAAGITLGVTNRTGRARIQPFVRAQLGQLDVGPVSSRAVGIGGGLSVTVTP